MPRLKNSHIYHMTELCNWSSIRRHGLLSTSRLLDLAGIRGAERNKIERQQRLHALRLSSGVTIRDQIPIAPNALKRCLTNGMTHEDWYAELNRRVFFWLDPERLNRQRRACASSPQVVLVMDADRLVSCCQSKTALTPFNTGNARRKAARRSHKTFVPYDEWKESGWAWEANGLKIRQRPLSHRPVELTVLNSVENVLDFIVDVRPLGVGEYLAS
jgi:Family of unknown function (DUF7002)